MSNTNGSGNGAGYGPKRLEKLLAEYEGYVAAIKTVMAVLNVDARKSASERAGTTITNALALDAARRTANGNGHEPKRRGRPPKHAAMKYTTKRQKQRARSLAFLEQFSETKPLPIAAIKGPRRIAGALIRRGYLLNGPDGYLRTEKPFTV